MWSSLLFFFFFSFHTKGVLKRRDQIQGELDSKVDALANKKTEKDLVSIFRKPDSSRSCCDSRRGAEGHLSPEARGWHWLLSLPFWWLFVPGKGHHQREAALQQLGCWREGLVMVGYHWPLSTHTVPQLIFSFSIC